MRRFFVVFLVVGLLALVFSAGVLAQDSVLAFLDPIVIDIAENVPVEVTVSVPVDGGEPITTTVPMTVGVALRVEVLGPNVLNVTASEGRGSIAVSSSSSQPASPEARVGEVDVDRDGRGFVIDPSDDVALVSVNSRAGSFAFEVFGEVQNTGSRDIEYLEIIVTLYSPDGEIVETTSTYAKMDTLAPGAVSPFNAVSFNNDFEVGSYKIQFNP